MTGFDKTRLPHTSRFVTLRIITQCRSKLSLSNVALLLHNAMKSFCEKCRSKAYRVVKLQAVKVDELGSLVLSYPVTCFFIVKKAICD